MKKYICVFCDERKYADTAHINCGNIGICRECFDALSKNAPASPYQGKRNISYIMSSFEYTDELRRVFLDYKFGGCYAYAPLFAEMMREYIKSYDIWNEFDYLIPVPLHKSRLKERGYNQAELIAHQIIKYLGLELKTDCLFRMRATRRQSSLKMVDKVQNVKDAFVCREDMSRKKIILFDDICTTGNTLISCADALKNAGAEDICALTLAVPAEKKLPAIMY